MSMVPPPVPPMPATPPAPAVAPVTVSVSVAQAPPAVAALPAEAVLTATVTQTARAGQPIVLDTPLGPLTGRLGATAAAALPEGMVLSLRVQSIGRDLAVFRVLGPVGGVPGGPGMSGAATGRAGGPPGLAAGGDAHRPGAILGRADGAARGAITATVVHGAARPGWSGAPVGGGGMGEPLPLGTRMSVQVMGIRPSGTPQAAVPGGGVSGANAGSGGVSGGPPLGAPSSPSLVSSGSSSGAASGPAGAADGVAAPGSSGRVLGSVSALVSRVAGTATSALAAGNAGSATTGVTAGPVPTASPTPAQPTTLTGTVMPGAPAGQSVLTTGVGTLALPVRLDAPPGSQVTLSVLATTPPASGAPGAAAAGPAVPQGGLAGWPVWTEAVETLNRVDPAAARALEAAIPRPGPQLAFAVASLAGALRAGGDLRQWPGEGAVGALERSGPAGARLAGALKSDLSDLAGRVRESPGGEWRAMTLPFADQAEIAPITLIVRVPGGRGDANGEGEGDDDPGQGDPGQRFLVDVTLSALGRLQIDGLMQSRARRLHLILRTDRPLPEAMRRDLQAIVDSSLSAFGLAGGLSLHPGEDFLKPVPAVAGDGDGGFPPPGGLVA
ncbi:hypothetical protein F1188_08865 [Roseospira marina]|uniref:Flagellar hook-length control protein FliK n=1 Tax=Roseospira marina TaxID=140057 RepID=A0A5M6ICM5_9PROT|nr:hypothetical protein [Roseospira marina]KAA5605727.1 hypothetical protein F1188_08865 [Roseospira marina]MBB4313528.1 hypothetical protein [Roseospira marina]MBB5086690.1 hypothetical protein [Roseospira marina]